MDATPNSSGTDYVYNNSYTSHKLLALEQADGLGEIENGGSANAGDYYNTPKSFSPKTNPNSNRYSGTATNVVVDSLTAAGATMSAWVGISSNDIPASPTGLTATVASSSSINLNWNPVHEATSYNVYRAISPRGLYSLVVLINLFAEKTYQILIKMEGI